MEVITTELLGRLSVEAALAPRLRKNHNIHPANESQCHRLLNAIEPSSYIRPHRHLDPEKGETFVLMNGRLGIITFTNSGEIAESVLLSRENGNLAVNIPSAVFHTAVSLEPGTVFFEAKAGPYLSLTEDEVAAWSPNDASDCALTYLEQLRGLFL